MPACRAARISHAIRRRKKIVQINKTGGAERGIWNILTVETFVKKEYHRKRCVPLEPAAEEVCHRQIPKPPLIFELPPPREAMVLKRPRIRLCDKYPARVGKVRVNTGKMETIPVWLVDPGFLPAGPT